MNTNIITLTFTADNMITINFHRKIIFTMLTFVFVLNLLLDNSVYVFKESTGCNKYSPKRFTLRELYFDIILERAIFCRIHFRFIQNFKN